MIPLDFARTPAHVFSCFCHGREYNVSYSREESAASKARSVFSFGERIRLGRGQNYKRSDHYPVVPAYCRRKRTACLLRSAAGRKEQPKAVSNQLTKRRKWLPRAVRLRTLNSVSRFRRFESRFRSARDSAAVWQRISRFFSSAFVTMSSNSPDSPGFSRVAAGVRDLESRPGLRPLCCL